MAETCERLALVKLLAAAAWADGELSPEEKAMLERIGVALGLDESERSGLEESLQEPVGLEEAERLAREALPRLPAEEREAWIGRIQKIIDSDAQVAPGEARLLQIVRETLEKAGNGSSLLNRVRGFFRGERETAKEPDRKSRLLGQILGGMPRRESRSPIDPERLEHATLFGAILYRVAYADGTFSEKEAERLRSLLSGAFGFDEEEVEQVLAVIESKAAEDLDRQRLCASFNRVTDMDARMRLLGCLFMVAAADGAIDDAELREMRLIANYLWIGARDFHKVRMQHWAGGGWRAN